MEDIAAVLDKAPLGFGFRPTDEELVEYLRHKLLGDDDRFNIFPEIDLCKVDPWQVPGLPIIKSDDPQRFFFSPVDYKYANSKRFNRTTNCGFWKSTGNDRYIKVSGTDDVWKKKTLVYHKGRAANGVNSNWVIHEYYSVTFPENQRCFVLCHLKNKAGKGGTDASIYDEGEPRTGGHIASSDHENMTTEEGIQPVGAFPEMNMETTFQSMHREERDFPPVQWSGIEQEVSFTHFPTHNAYFRNEDCDMQTIAEGNAFPTSIVTPTQQPPTGIIEQEASFTCFSAHNAYFRNEDCDMQTPVESIAEGNACPTSIVTPVQQPPIGIIEQEASFTRFPAHNAYSRNEDCDMQTPVETIAEGNVFPTSIVTPIQQPTIGIIEQEASFTRFPAHNAYFRIEDCDMQTPDKTIIEGKAFPTSIVTPIQQPPNSIIEQKASFTRFPAHNTYFRNEDCDMQIPVETIEGEDESFTSIFGSFEITEEENEFLKSIFADSEEGGHVFVNSSTQPESLKKVHCESNDTNVEVASTLYGNIVDTSAMCNSHPSSGEYHVSKRLKSTHGTDDGGIHLGSSDQEANNEESIIQNYFWGVETSSCDSTTDKPLEANCVEISSSPSTLRRWKNKHHPRPSNFIFQKTTARRSQRQRKASSNAVSHLEVRKSNNYIGEMEKPT